mmetsp:Transcript_63393/g.160434  ORF Transcript_63393/g.160434 Transcript_63393/m.160434 type:complete len:256 (+) Transcript_63393:470-1237(+)
MVQDVVDTALSIQEDSEDVLQVDAALPFWCSEATLRLHIVVAEEGVNAGAHECMCLHMVTDDIATVAMVAKILLCHVVRQLALVEEGLAVLPIPDCLVAQGVLCKQAVHDDVVPVHLQGVEDLVPRVRDADVLGQFVVGAPEPQVIPYDVRGVDQNHLVCLHLGHGRIPVPADAAEDVIQEAGVLDNLATVCTPLNQSVATSFSTLDHQSSNAHPLQIVLHEDQGIHEGCIIGLLHCGHTESQDHSIALADHNGL